MRVDAHQHFWQFDPVRDNWINEDMAAIQKDFMPQDLQPLLAENGFNGCVAVEAHQSEAQTEFLVQLANNNHFIKGVVGWVDLQSDNIAERLQHFSQYKIIKGFRHVLQGEPQRDLMLSPAFVRGIAALKEFDFTYDILIFPDQLIFSKNLVAQFPEQKFVIDHLAKPHIKKKEIKEWTLDIESIAKLPNVYCKVSGMVTEADWKGWKKDDFRPYMDVIVENFGIDRILFGSDWPVCLVAASYKEVVDIVQDYFSAFSADEQQKVFGGNAVSFYNL
ncbi:MAG TPA: amidohydrolase family protein [Flavisolibacter sp.]|nr:amidohydrolase family protein [Flavisolibacter sp.]